MKGPRRAVCQHNQDNSYEFRLKINAEHYTWISYDDFKSFLLTHFMPVVRQKLDEMNVPPKEGGTRMSGELVDRINELLLQIAAMEFDINSLKAEVMHQRAKAEAYEAVLEGTQGEDNEKE